MRKIFALAAITATLFSCSNDDDNSAPAEEAFFNFEIGDTWAYKHYSQNSEGTFIFNSVIDTVKIVGTQEFYGETYFDFETKTYGTGGNLSDTNHTYQRVDENGHLINSRGRIVSPGNDTDFTDNYPYTMANNDTIGYMATQLFQQQDIEVEGQSYSAYNYQSYFTPVANGGAAGIGYQTFFSPGIGLVLRRYRYLNSEGLKIEYRLVYHN
ncbi:hypothetical protein ACLI09_03640 [Flavobacterium sp. RHBU_24]|uniref:hypothetical protein n=1 Tax=Flavobacterium sp. RHBU_24 TaxID=3391185 RepID=UPI003984DCA1